ncbi:DUF1850 domain-containing protein [Carboxydochorda subterranea]|uniref:DUF1850 domain-containing protein n=1 Tax=Carboxydichorda subterranea TaxID=3109565 RepID=A0ABZ1BVC1_9FIRM|nr:DUF1850 domain-containing protein [Limnochorda sp. L945t]WRP16471.1 DUF1850 domain-containing protein [Limnochorda sp. L945t]
MPRCAQMLAGAARAGGLAIALAASVVLAAPGGVAGEVPAGEAVWVEVRDAASGALLLRLSPDHPDAAFSIEYRHSVEKTRVREYFRWDDGIVLYRTEYSSLGAGLPPEGRLEWRDGQAILVLDGLHRVIPHLVVRTWPWTEHQLWVNGQAYPLSRLAGPGAALELEIVGVGEEHGGT